MTIADDAGVTGPAERNSAPWYIEFFLAVGGWIAGLLGAGAVFTLTAAILPDMRESYAAAVIASTIGAAMTLAGVKIAEGGRSEFRRHFAIAGVAAGLTAATGGIWYLCFLLSETLTPGAGDTVRLGASGLAVAALYLAAAALVAHAVKDGILTFLATLAWLAITLLSAGLLNEEKALSASLYYLLAPAAAAAGVVLFTHRLHRAAAAALMIGPALFYEILRASDPAGAHAGATYPALAGFGGAGVYALWSMRDRFPTLGLAGTAALVLTGLWFLPPAGAISVIILLAGFAAGHRGVAAIGVAALAWFITRFYYDLSMTLLEKAAILGGLGAATLLGALGLQRRRSDDAERPQRQAMALNRSVGALIGVTAVFAAALGYVNYSAWRLEKNFEKAVEILLPLGPRDPRSIFQGDYMALAFRETIFPPPTEIENLPERGEVFLALDEDMVASYSRIARDGDIPHTNEIRVDYVKRDAGRLRYCPESFFFQEGEGPAYEAARFAVVRAAPDGKTRLVALADENRTIIRPGEN